MNELNRKGYAIDEHLIGYLDECNESTRTEEINDDDDNDIEDDDECCFLNETNSLFNRYRLASILIEYEFLQKHYE